MPSIRLTRLVSLLSHSRAPHWGTLLSGILLPFAFAPWDAYFLIGIALVPWFHALQQARSLRAAALQGLWLCVLMSLGGFYWVGYTLHQFGQLPWPVAALGLGLFSLICQPQFYFFAPLWKAFRARATHDSWRGAGATLLVALAYAGLDWALPKLFVDTFGHAFYSAPALRQIADLGGAWFLSFWAVLINLVLFEALTELSLVRARIKPFQLKEKGPIYLVAILFSLAVGLYGHLRLQWLENYFASQSASAPHAQLAAIQANIGDIDKLAAESGYRRAADQIVDTYLSLSEKALSLSPKPQALIWPETSFPSAFRTPRHAAELVREQKIEAFARTHEIPLWFGGYDRQNQKDYNSLFFLSPNLELQTYHKNILLLFGEYIPGMESIRWLKEQFPQIGNFGRGPGPTVFQLPLAPNASLPTVNVQPVICYEALFPNYAIEGARKGAQLLLNATNDSWFGPWGEPPLHLSLTVFRSIETRLPQFRATNTGISALISPLGTLDARTAVFQPEIMNVSVPLIPAPWTLMKHWGDWFGPFALLWGLFPLLSWVLWRKRHPLKQVSNF